MKLSAPNNNRLGYQRARSGPSLTSKPQAQVGGAVNETLSKARPATKAKHLTGNPAPPAPPAARRTPP
ncbi:hypothetical protein GCM10023339_78280 [Alloalcanivorax gelatiniphagus]